MKTYYLSVLLLLTMSLGAYAQKEYSTEYEVHYEVEYYIDSTNFDKKSTETLYLFTGSENGVFMNYSEAHKDEIRADLLRQLKTTGQVTITKVSSNFPRIFYKDLQNGQVTTADKIDTKAYIFKEPNLPSEWIMEEDTKEIMGYQAQKATTHFAGRDYVAWFTLEIPISDGPYVFSGLPGLIIELYDTQDHYHFQLKSIDKMEETKRIELPKSDEIAKIKFQELQQKINENSQNNTLDYGGYQMKIVSTDGMSQEDKMANQKVKRDIKENKARINNLIELE